MKSNELKEKLEELNKELGGLNKKLGEEQGNERIMIREILGLQDFLKEYSVQEFLRKKNPPERKKTGELLKLSSKELYDLKATLSNLRENVIPTKIKELTEKYKQKVPAIENHLKSFQDELGVINYLLYLRKQFKKVPIEDIRTQQDLLLLWSDQGFFGETEMPKIKSRPELENLSLQKLANLKAYLFKFRKNAIDTKLNELTTICEKNGYNIHINLSYDKSHDGAPDESSGEKEELYDDKLAIRTLLEAEGFLKNIAIQEILKQQDFLKEELVRKFLGETKPPESKESWKLTKTLTLQELEKFKADLLDFRKNAIDTKINELTKKYEQKEPEFYKELSIFIKANDQESLIKLLLEKETPINETELKNKIEKELTDQFFTWQKAQSPEVTYHTKYWNALNELIKSCTGKEQIPTFCKLTENQLSDYIEKLIGETFPQYL